jgi:glucosamine 6-phosphate synthetase-like amidotransferase/phosphosugar isomerase protein
MTFSDIQIMSIVSMFQELSGQNNGKPFHDVKALTTNGKPKELFFSSDLCAIVEHTKNYLAIEDNEIVHIKVLCNCLFCYLHPYPVILSFSPS